MEKLSLYLKEAKFLKWYIFAVFIVILLCYSLYLILDIQTISNLAWEDGFFESMTAINFMFAAVILFILFLKSKNFFVLLMAVAFFTGCAEEISWGQRIFKYVAPEFVAEENVQNEFNIHNLEIFNPMDLRGIRKTGLARFLEINFLFKLTTMLFGIALPLLVFHFKIFKNISKKLRFPVPPITIGIFFIINWIIMRVVTDYVMPKGLPAYDYFSPYEIFEFQESFILLVISLVFILNRTKHILGLDIKHTL